MAIVNINYDCGCGFHGRTVEEAIKHADERGHTLTVTGIVKSSVRKVRTTHAVVYSHATKLSPMVAPVEDQDDKIDFNSLRVKLQGK